MAQDKLVKLCQRNLIAKEFFQQFNILSRLAGYSIDHDHFLIDLIEQNIKFSLIKKVYLSGLLSNTLKDYKNCMIALDTFGKKACIGPQNFWFWKFHERLFYAKLETTN